MAAPETHANYDPPQSNPARPASPALTNPDMILPEYEHAHPLMPHLDDQADSRLAMRNNAAQATTSVRDLQLFFAGASSGQPVPDPERPNGVEAFHATPIIYGNGTMLSDIGEVTEVESTTGHSSSSTAKERLRGAGPSAHGNRRVRSGDSPRSSLTSGAEANSTKTPKQKPPAQRERRSSLESISTITARDHAELFADFDDSVSVDDSVFQGDDEESIASIASSAWEESTAQATRRLAIPYRGSTERLSVHSTTSISYEADQILANAKKRLTTMEDNLSRARTNVHVPSSASRSSLGFENSTPPSPVFQQASESLYRSNGAMLSIHVTGHGRNSSEDIPRTGLIIKDVSERSQSAMGAAGRYGPSLTGSRSVDQIRSTQNTNHPRSPHEATASRYGGFLEPLSEDEVSPTASLGLSRGGPTLDLIRNSLAVEDDHSVDNNVPARSASTNQMRDIKGQVIGLKGKISSLRDQARADSIRRRSLQNLRNPSPFTHAQVEQWYAEPSPQSVLTINNENHGGLGSTWTVEEFSSKGESKANLDSNNVPAEDDEESMQSEWDMTGLMMDHDLAAAHSVAPRVREDEVHVVTDDTEDDLAGFQDVEDLGSDSETGDSLYHDTVQYSISHEDRDDAFDYEHFFLHSAMGTIRQQDFSRQGSVASDSSEDSVETARGPEYDYDSDEDYNTAKESRPDNLSRIRANSGSSISTVGTFATADDGRASRVSKTGVKDEAPRRKVKEISGSTTPPQAELRDGESTEPVPNNIGEGARIPTPNGVRNDVWAGGSYDGSSRSAESAPPGEDGEPGPLTNTIQARSLSSPISQPVSPFTTGSTRRPSFASFESTRTTRSFPLVNKPKKCYGCGAASPSSSFDQELGSVSNRLLQETANAFEQQQQVRLGHADTKHREDDDHKFSGSMSPTSSLQTGSRLAGNSNAPAAMQAMLREDQIQVERLVACLGHCILGLTENGRASDDSRMIRHRIDRARRILEGLEVE